MAKLYVVEVVYDYLTQCGCSLDKKTAQSMAEKLQKKNCNYEYFVTEYNIDNNYTEFESY